MAAHTSTQSWWSYKKIGDCEQSKHFPANLKTYYKPLRDFEIESTFFKAPVFWGTISQPQLNFLNSYKTFFTKFIDHFL